MERGKIKSLGKTFREPCVSADSQVKDAPHLWKVQTEVEQHVLVLRALARK